MNDIKSILINGTKFIRNITSTMKVVDTKHANYYVLQNPGPSSGPVKSLNDVIFKTGQLRNNNEVADGTTFTTNITPLFTAADANGTPWIIAYADLEGFNPSTGGGGSKQVILFKANDVKLEIGGVNNPFYINDLSYSEMEVA